jgi:hypothetical protein
LQFDTFGEKMFLNKKAILITFIISTVTAMILLYVSISMTGVILNNFETGTGLSLYDKIIYYTGMIISGYLMLPVFILPKYIQDSFWGGLLSYVFSILMVWICVLPLYVHLRNKFKRRKG